MNRRRFLMTGDVTGSLIVGSGCISQIPGVGDIFEGSIIEHEFQQNITVDQHPLDPPEINFISDNNRVIIVGKVSISGSCNTAALKSVIYDAETDTVTVTISGTRREDAEPGTCGDSVGVEPYRVTITFEHDLPQTVVVVEDDAGKGSKTTTAQYHR